jgi:hypothetical protein
MAVRMIPLKCRKDSDMSTDEESRKKTCRSLFSYLGRNPGSWWLSSTRLKDAADALRDTCWPKEKKQHDLKAATANFRLGPVYMLLMGMAIEDALKTIIVAQDDECIRKKVLSKDFATHDLKVLWSKAGLNRCRDERLLGRLQNFVVSFGRYPVSRTEDYMDTMMGSSFHAEPDFDKVTRLWTFLEQHATKVL